MGLAKVFTRAQAGVAAPLVEVEVHLSTGLPAFNLVGLPEASVKEAKERVRSAIINSGLEFPMRRITVNLAPAELPKFGGRYDLAIALGILVASKQLPCSCIENSEFIGELGLAGEVRHCKGVLPVIIAAQDAEHNLYIPKLNAADNDLAQYNQVQLCESLISVCHGLTGQLTLERNTEFNYPQSNLTQTQVLGHIIGQSHAKQALMIAAAGGHHMLMLGPPGTGKTLLANSLSRLLPPLNLPQALQTAAIHSISGYEVDPSDLLKPPFRSPHHTSSAVALIGGGPHASPGEISLAHNGVLFLDELTEFSKSVLDSLREPFESGEVYISRAAHKHKYPAQFQLIAAMNPSPCGSADENSRATNEQILRYLNKLSGPFLDRFDMSIEVPQLPPGSLKQAREKTQKIEDDSGLLERVNHAREKQFSRQGCLNTRLSGTQLAQLDLIPESELDFLESSVEKLGLSIRSYHRLQRVAISIMDLSDKESVQREHILQALSYRAMDKLLLRLTQHY
ncbi:YifB family Mg chelatase-like AAA ATPase [Paraferrimonas sp. SM1919]|uniref:YifB family Mg chelatase-like AAA ATPase n=1 Tax=Paraferrimonas sp. SM1919 TaxID=2662263 RepID=UPI0013D3A661|nr:YifB family Mg chelatase-like AAA ATPase [Paraferrimonas sp. SM1919]